MLILPILLYSKMVDKVRRYYLLITYSSLYAILSLVFVFFLGHPTIGLGNTNQSFYRLFGWLFYLFIEGYSPFVLSVFWAFANSITSLEESKNNYGLMVAGSKLGGMCTAAFAWALFSSQAIPFIGNFSGVAKHQIILLVSTLFLMFIPITILLLMHKVPGRYLRGYEAAYKIEKLRGKHGKTQTGVFAGLKMFMKYPYVLGIFCMVFFYEILSTVLRYSILGIAESTSSSVSDISGFLFKWVFIMHATGFCIALFGTSILLKKLGIRMCLLLIPASTGFVLLCFVLNSTTTVLMSAFILMKAIYYAFSWPVREALYIPTIKEIKFKSKSWIDAFGSKLAKSTGSTFNIFAEGLGPFLFVPTISLFFAFIISIWFIAAWLLGNRFDRAVKNNEVIGSSDSLG